MTPSTHPSVRAYVVMGLILVAIDCAFMAKALAPGMVRCPGDIIAATEPMARPGAPAAANPYLADWSNQFYPWSTLVRRAWHEGRPPLWNDLNGVGQPLAANMQCGAFSPYLPLTIGAGDDQADVQQLAQMILAQFFCLLLARRLKWSAIGAGALALGFSYSSYMQSWCMHPHTASAAFTPLILLVLLNMRERPSLAQTALGGLAVGLSVLSGHLESAVMAGLVATLIAAFHRPETTGVKNGFFRYLSGVAGVASTGLFLAAVLILPFLDYLDQSPVTLLRTLQKGTPLPAENLRTLLDPHALGDAVGANSYRGAHNAVDGVFFIGRLLIALAAAGAAVGLFTHPRRTIGLILTTALGVSIAFAPPPLFEIWKKLPVLSHMPLVRFVFVATVPLVFLGAAGAEAMLGLLRSRFGGRVALGTGVLALAIMTTESFLQWRDFVPVVPHAALHSESPAIRALAETSASGRALPLGHMLPPEMNAAFGIRSLRTYDAIGSERHLMLLHEAQSFFGETWTQAAVFCDPKILDLAGVGTILSRWPADRSPAPTNGTLLDAAHPVVRTGPAPAGQTLELFFFRGSKKPVRDGTIRVKVGTKDGKETAVTLAKDAPAEVRGPHGVFRTTPDAAVRDLMTVNYGEFDTGYTAFTYDAIEGLVTNTVEVAPGGEPVLVYLVARDGLGKGTVEIARDGEFRVSQRPTALPRVFFTTAIRAVPNFKAALAEVKKADFDPQKEALVEGAESFVAAKTETGVSPKAVSFRSPTPETIEIEGDFTEDGWIVVLDLPARGWKATLENGRETKIFPANVIGRAVFVPKGKHTVTMRYTPNSVLAGAVLSATTLILLLAAFVRGAWIGRRARTLSAT